MSKQHAPKAATESTLRALDKQIADLRKQEQTLEGKCKLVAIAADAASLGLALPADLPDSVAAYQWLAAQRQRIGMHTSTPGQMAAAHEIRTEHLGPLQAELQAVQNSIKEISTQRQQVKAQLEAATAPDMIDQLQKQVKLLTSSQKTNQANADRLAKDAADLRLELTELGAQELAFDEQMAVDVAAGKHVDDDALVSMHAQRLAKEKRLKVTIAAHQKALESTKEDRQAIDQHRDEIKRLEGVLERNKIRTALASTIEQLVSDGQSRARVLEMMKAFN